MLKRFFFKVSLAFANVGELGARCSVSTSFLQVFNKKLQEKPAIYVGAHVPSAKPVNIADKNLPPFCANNAEQLLLT